MSAKVEIPNLDYWIKRYKSGESIVKLSREIGVGENTLTKRLHEGGIVTRTSAEARRLIKTKPKRITVPNLTSLIKRYIAGESENQLSREAGINRSTFRTRLLGAGVKPRSRSAAEIAKWKRISPARRKEQMAPAHAATRGRKHSLAEKIKRAQTAERQQERIVPVERMLGDWLKDAGFAVTFQKAVGPYNLDIAIDEPSVAVEIFGGGWHAYGRHLTRHFERTKYLLDLGWHVVIIWVDGRRYPLGVAVRDYLITFSEELRRNPAPSRQYRVILGDGKTAPVRNSYLNTPADIERLGNGG